MPEWLEATWPARLLVVLKLATITELERMPLVEVWNWLDTYDLWHRVSNGVRP